MSFCVFLCVLCVFCVRLLYSTVQSVSTVHASQWPRSQPSDEGDYGNEAGDIVLCAHQMEGGDPSKPLMLCPCASVCLCVSVCVCVCDRPSDMLEL